VPLGEGGPAMPKFKIGDRVETIGSLVSKYMRNGTIIRVTPNEDGHDLFTEYDVNFSDQLIGHFYETQLRLVKPPKDSSWLFAL